MKLTVLVDNNTYVDRYFYAEPGLSFFIEVDDKKILFDTGFSNIFLKNASKMDINLFDLDYVVLSHGHSDHTWGMGHLIEAYASKRFENIEIKKPKIVTHPATFFSKRMDKIGELGMVIDENRLNDFFMIIKAIEPIWITDQLVFLGEIPRVNDFEGKDAIGKVLINDVYEDDYILEDSALVYKSDQGLVIITGCSHAGICNIVEQAKKVFECDKVCDIIGGFHLQNPTQKKLVETVNYLKDLNLSPIHPCHCTDLKSKINIEKSVEIEEVGVGFVLKY